MRICLGQAQSKEGHVEDEREHPAGARIFGAVRGVSFHETLPAQDPEDKILAGSVLPRAPSRGTRLLGHFLLVTLGTGTANPTALIPGFSIHS